MAAQTKPNILFIMADDTGWFNSSCYNHGIMGYQSLLESPPCALQTIAGVIVLLLAWRSPWTG